MAVGTHMTAFYQPRKQPLGNTLLNELNDVEASLVLNLNTFNETKLVQLHEAIVKRTPQAIPPIPPIPPKPVCAKKKKNETKKREWQSDAAKTKEEKAKKAKTKERKKKSAPTSWAWAPSHAREKTRTDGALNDASGRTKTKSPQASDVRAQEVRGPLNAPQSLCALAPPRRRRRRSGWYPRARVPPEQRAHLPRALERRPSAFEGYGGGPKFECACDWFCIAALRGRKTVVAADELPVEMVVVLAESKPPKYSRIEDEDESEKSRWVAVG
ncbi:hypothetical protein C8F04DRAFT_1240384 [Mycena alexandri]|uniref:Uncharacterized protein n=1 Tax=Mycena alexandri TaxID=1745969 RepID=A0AAD6WRW6_9AGAR|nr:hypothetical protein C8F04DRAFT_1240384 [Mycena alexandri]